MNRKVSYTLFLRFFPLIALKLLFSCDMQEAKTTSHVNEKISCEVVLMQRIKEFEQNHTFQPHLGKLFRKRYSVSRETVVVRI